MRKKLVLLLIGVSLLACGCRKGGDAPTEPVASTAANVETESATTAETEPTETWIDDSIEIANYKTEVKDNFTGYFQGQILTNSNNVLEKDVSDKDSDRILGYIFVEYPVVAGDTDAAKKINAYFDRSKEPLPTSGIAEYILWDYEYGRFDVEAGEVYMDYSSTTISVNTERYFAVIHYYDWYAGGVSNTALYGDTFDSQTGECLSIVDFFEKESGLSAQETQDMIVACSEKYVAEHADEEGPELVEAIKAYKPEDYAWFIGDAGDIYVTLGPYEAGYGGWYRAIPLDFKI